MIVEVFYRCDKCHRQWKVADTDDLRVMCVCGGVATYVFARCEDKPEIKSTYGNNLEYEE